MLIYIFREQKTDYWEQIILLFEILSKAAKKALNKVFVFLLKSKNLFNQKL